MFESYEFLKLILNTVTENIVVIDSEGEIRCKYPIYNTVIS